MFIGVALLLYLPAAQGSRSVVTIPHKSGLFRRKIEEHYPAILITVAMLGIRLIKKRVVPEKSYVYLHNSVNHSIPSRKIYKTYPFIICLGSPNNQGATPSPTVYDPPPPPIPS